MSSPELFHRRRWQGHLAAQEYDRLLGTADQLHALLYLHMHTQSGLAEPGRALGSGQGLGGFMGPLVSQPVRWGWRSWWKVRSTPQMGILLARCSARSKDRTVPVLTDARLGGCTDGLE